MELKTKHLTLENQLLQKHVAHMVIMPVKVNMAVHLALVVVFTKRPGLLQLQVLVRDGCTAVISHFHTAQLTEDHAFRSLPKSFPTLTLCMIVDEVSSPLVLRAERSYLYFVVGGIRHFDARFFKVNVF